jgi:hypothetical protein
MIQLVGIVILGFGIMPAVLHMSRGIEELQTSMATMTVTPTTPPVQKK